MRTWPQSPAGPCVSPALWPRLVARAEHPHHPSPDTSQYRQGRVSKLLILSCLDSKVRTVPSVSDASTSCLHVSGMTLLMSEPQREHGAGRWFHNDPGAQTPSPTYAFHSPVFNAPLGSQPHIAGLGLPGPRMVAWGHGGPWHSCGRAGEEQGGWEPAAGEEAHNARHLFCVPGRCATQQASLRERQHRHAATRMESGTAPQSHRWALLGCAIPCHGSLTSSGRFHPDRQPACCYGLHTDSPSDTAPLAVSMGVTKLQPRPREELVSSLPLPPPGTRRRVPRRSRQRREAAENVQHNARQDTRRPHTGCGGSRGRRHSRAPR